MRVALPRTSSRLCRSGAGADGDKSRFRSRSRWHEARFSGRLRAESPVGHLARWRKHAVWPVPSREKCVCFISTALSLLYMAYWDRMKWNNGGCLKADGDTRGFCQTVLVVDDEEIVQDTVASILQRMGYRILAARDTA